MATRARLGKAAAAAVAGAERILLTPRKIFGGGQAAGTKPDSEALPQSTGLRASDDVPLQSPAPLARISNAHADSEIMEQLRVIQEGQQLMQEEQHKGMQLQVDFKEQLRVIQEGQQLMQEEQHQSMHQSMHQLQQTMQHAFAIG
jgi:hypothetical protein